MTPTEAAHARPRVEGDREREILEAALAGARRRGLRPADDGRRRRPGQGVQGHALPALVDQGLAGHRRPAPPEGPDHDPRHGVPARRPDRGVLRHGGARPRGRVHALQRPDRHRPRRGVRPRVPRAGDRPQDGDLPARSTSGRWPAARSARTSTSPCSARPSPGSCSTAPTSWVRRRRPSGSLGSSTRSSSLPLWHRPRRNPMADLTKAEVRAPGQHAHLGWALVLISVAQLMVVLDATIANIALPYIGADLDIDQANLSWIVTGYALAFGGLLLLGGRLGDLYGRRRVFMAGLTMFAIASLLGGLAQNEALLLVRPWPPGPRRRARLPRRPGADHHDLPGRPAAQPRVRGLRRDVRCRRGRRPDPRWLADRPRQRPRHRDQRLAADLPDQRPDRPRGRLRSRPACWRSPSRTPASSTSRAPSPAPSACWASSSA